MACLTIRRALMKHLEEITADNMIVVFYGQRAETFTWPMVNTPQVRKNCYEAASGTVRPLARQDQGGTVENGLLG